MPLPDAGKHSASGSFAGAAAAAATAVQTLAVAGAQRFSICCNGAQAIRMTIYSEALAILNLVRLYRRYLSGAKTRTMCCSRCSRYAPRKASKSRVLARS
jgi:hypothetical protein